MKFDPESALHLLLEQALKNVTLDGYASFWATFFVQFMPVASLVIRDSHYSGRRKDCLINSIVRE